MHKLNTTKLNTKNNKEEKGSEYKRRMGQISS